MEDRRLGASDKFAKYLPFSAQSVKRAQKATWHIAADVYGSN